MHPDYDKKIYRVDSDDIDTTLGSSTGSKYSLGEVRVYTSLNENVLLEAFRSIAFEEPNDLAKTLIEYYYELKHKPEGERITILKKKLEDEYRLNL